MLLYSTFDCSYFSIISIYNEFLIDFKIYSWFYYICSSSCFLLFYNWLFSDKLLFFICYWTYTSSFFIYIWFSFELFYYSAGLLLLWIGICKATIFICWGTCSDILYYELITASFDSLLIIFCYWLHNTKDC